MVCNYKGISFYKEGHNHAHKAKTDCAIPVLLLSKVGGYYAFGDHSIVVETSCKTSFKVKDPSFCLPLGCIKSQSNTGI